MALNLIHTKQFEALTLTHLFIQTQAIVTKPHGPNIQLVCCEFCCCGGVFTNVESTDFTADYR